ncbi:MAG TPA: MOSC domain-containing protein [Actinomycetota bacterium]|nr:MOSC domain-containing protein [Actinomycetota bacterium]
MWQGTVDSVYIGPRAKEPMQRVDEVKAVAGRGLEGDRYFNLGGSFSEDEHLPKREVTLIEAESLEAAGAEAGVQLDPADSRRNIVTRGVPLNHLVDTEFSVGEVRLRGIKLAEPCAHLARVAGKGLLKPLIHRAGLRAQILNDGVIRSGDTVRVAPYRPA